MKVTKFQHACLAVEHEGTTLIVDPGVYSHDFIVPKRVNGIVITHNHPDHLSQSLLKTILTKHPKATIISHASITSQFSDYATLAVQSGERHTIGAISLTFFGGEHAPIAEGVEVPANLAVLINDSLYYPGDSFTIPRTATRERVAVDTLALPISAPWLNFAQAREVLKIIHPTLVFPTHDGLLSEDGKQLMEQMLGSYASSQNIVYKRLDGQTLDLS
jgi:L-ascorbate metabolism protein UlaG (beta-lactamase superfamily)